MLKSFSWIIALSIIAAPMLPARADIVFRSTPNRSSIRVNSGVGYPHRRGIRHYPNQVIIRQNRDNSYPGVVRPYYPYNRSYNNRVLIERSNTYTPYFPHNPYDNNNPYYRHPRTVIVVPGTVIVNPGYSNSIPNCGTTIYGSSIASPIPVNPYTGLACR